MKLFVTCIKIIRIYTYSIIGLLYPYRPVYISSQIQEEQVYYYIGNDFSSNRTTTVAPKSFNISFIKP